jgi:FixJ family two-component response regulator
LLVESRPGEGTVFSVLLPAAGEMFSRPPSGKEPAAWRTRGTVVVGIDDKSLRMRVARWLVRLGYAVVASAGGYLVSDTCREHVGGISAALIDTPIPPYSARDAFNAILDMRRGIAIVLVSSHTEKEVMAEYAASCCAGFLQKPFTDEQLAEVIEKACLNAGPRL